jgi:hypothetical protein
MRRERDEFGWAQKNDRGVTMAFDKYSHAMKQRAGVEPDLFIVDRRMQSFMNLEVPLLTEYRLAGPNGPRRFQTNSTSGSFRGCNVVNPPIFQSEFDDAEHVPITDDIRRIGNFFTNLYQTHAGLAGAQYKHALRTIKIYDESDNDEFVEITLKQCLENANYGSDGKLVLPDEATKEEFWAGFEDAEKKMIKEYTKNDWIKACDDNNVKIPLDFIIARPWMGYNMSTAILMKGGEETGRTNYGHVDVTTSNDGSNKTSLVNATWHMCSVIEKPDRIIQIPNIFYNGTMGGAGTFARLTLRKLTFPQAVDFTLRPNCLHCVMLAGACAI